MDGGLERLPRTFYTAAQPPPRRHEQFMVAIVLPLPPPEQVAIRREQVLHFLIQDLQVVVLSDQIWFEGIGLFELKNPVVRASLTHHDPFPLGGDEEGNELFVWFIPHNEGDGFRAIHGHRTG